MSAADGYGRITGKPQCVIVHVDVGTAALGQGLHNASSGKAPVLIFAGQAPLTLYGEIVGSRSEHVQWYQDIHNQHDIVAPYSRYSNEIKAAEQTRMLVGRALMMAESGNPGPTYLTATREVLAAQVDEKLLSRPKFALPSCKLGGLPADAVARVCDALLSAEKPLVVTGYLGRNHVAVQRLVLLADRIKGLKIFDFEFREMSFPADHPAWTSRATGAGVAIKTADVILVIDADVPWIPTKVKPSDDALIYHIDLDPRKEMMNLFDIHASETFAADSATALEQMTQYLDGNSKFAALEQAFTERLEASKASHAEGLRTLAARAAPLPNGAISTNHLFSVLRKILPGDTIYVNDVVTNQVPLSEQLQLVTPGTNLTKGGSGLGWAGGAAIGVKLATDMYDDISDRPNIRRRDTSNSHGTMTASVKADPEMPLSSNGHAIRNMAGAKAAPLVCSLTGDGSFLFSAPSSVYWAQHRLQTPFVSIILNNGGWKATRSCVNDVHPGGLAAAVTNEGLGIDLQNDGPDYLGIAVAAAGGKNRLLAIRVEKAEEIESALSEAVTWVREERKGAILEIIVS